MTDITIHLTELEAASVVGLIRMCADYLPVKDGSRLAVCAVESKIVAAEMLAERSKVGAGDGKAEGGAVVGVIERASLNRRSATARRTAALEPSAPTSPNPTLKEARGC